MKGSLLTVYYNVLEAKITNSPVNTMPKSTDILDSTVLESFELPDYFHDFTYNSW